MNNTDKKTRVAKMNSLLKELIGQIIINYLEPDFGLITVSRVECSSDLRWAKVWLSVFGGDEDKVLTHLKRNLYEIQGEINRKVNKKIVPRLQLFFDQSPQYVQHMEEVMKKVVDS